MKRNKAVGPDEIVIVVLSVLDDLGIDDSGKILENLSRDILIVPANKLDVNEYKCYQTISFMICISNH